MLNVLMLGTWLLLILYMSMFSEVRVLSGFVALTNEFNFFFFLKENFLCFVFSQVAPGTSDRR